MGGKREIKCPPGIKIRTWPSGRTTIMVQFYYRNVCCRETLSLEATSSNIKYAARRRAEIINAIERNQFNYADFFPDSKNARRFGHISSRVLIKELLDDYLQEVYGKTEYSTYTRYCKVCNTHLYPAFGEIAIQDLTSVTLRKWIQSLTCKKKTIDNIMTPLRAIIERALLDSYIDYNPLDKIKLSILLKKEQKKSRFKIDPFDREEINAILNQAKGQIKNLYQFAFFTGLRPSELMGLRWGDIDWIHNVIRIEETIVDKKTKDPKTEAGFREVLLLPPARRALEEQKAYTFLENKQVFQNPRTGKAWETSQQLRRTAWIHLLKKAGVRYRNPYQTRHTYASMLISQGENVLWVSKQMGHSNMQVTLRRYTNWLPDTNTKGGYQTRHDWGDYLGDRSGTDNAAENEADIELVDEMVNVRYLKR
jgi:integrase